MIPARSWIGIVTSLSAHTLAVVTFFIVPARFDPPEKTILVDFSIVPAQELQPTPPQPTVQKVRKEPPKILRKEEIVPDTTAPENDTPDIVAEDVSPSVFRPTPILPGETIGTRTGNIDTNAQKTGYVTAQYGAIRDDIHKHLSYPHIAIEEGWEGTVKVLFFVEKDGCIDDVRIEKSSGYALLDNSAKKAVLAAAPFPKAPFRLEIVLPVVFQLH